MKTTRRQDQVLNEILQEKTQNALQGRRFRSAINEKLDQKPIKLDRAGLRRLLSEAIQTKRPGEPEPFAVDEAFGTFDRENTYDDMGMMPHNFESSHHELFYQALQPVVDEFVKSMMEVYDAGMSPEGHKGADASVKKMAEEMRKELLTVVEKWTEEAADQL